MGVKVISVVDEVTYATSPDGKQQSIAISKINYIKYKDGSTYTVNSNIERSIDTAKVEWKPYLCISGGVSMPFPSGYGGSAYTSYSGYAYSGYAVTGGLFSATAGLKIYKGWELTGMFTYTQNQFDATKVMDATFMQFVNNYYYNDIQNVNTTGNYYYTDYSCLVGVSKNWEHRNGEFGISIMMGAFVTNIPAIQGTGIDDIYNNYNNYNGNYSYENCNITLNSQRKSTFVFEFGLHRDFNITPHIFIRGMAEFQFSAINPSGGYRVTDANTGNTIYSGWYPTYNYNYSANSLFIWLTDITAGVGYKF